MSAFPSDRERRGAERLPLPKPAPATLGGFAGKLIEFSASGCSFEHVERIPLKTVFTLKFSWRGQQETIKASVTRSEMRAAGGKPAYISGLQFADDARVIHEIVGWLKRSTTPEPEVVSEAVAVAPELVDEEPEELAAPFLRCTWRDGRWLRLYVDEPQQPADGFTIASPNSEAEIDVLCRAWEKAGEEGRRAMRASFELVIARRGPV